MPDPTHVALRTLTNRPVRHDRTPRFQTLVFNSMFASQADFNPRRTVRFPQHDCQMKIRANSQNCNRIGKLALPGTEESLNSTSLRLNTEDSLCRMLRWNNRRRQYTSQNPKSIPLNNVENSKLQKLIDEQPQPKLVKVGLVPGLAQSTPCKERPKRIASQRHSQSDPNKIISNYKQVQRIVQIQQLQQKKLRQRLLQVKHKPLRVGGEGKGNKLKLSMIKANNLTCRPWSGESAASLC